MYLTRQRKYDNKATPLIVEILYKSTLPQFSFYVSYWNQQTKMSRYMMLDSLENFILIQKYKYFILSYFRDNYENENNSDTKHFKNNDNLIHNETILKIHPDVLSIMWVLHDTLQY